MVDGGLPSTKDATTPCDENASPVTETCLLDDRYAVFVKKGAAGTGTKAAPAGTFSDVLAAAERLGKSRIIVCNGVYADPIAIRAGQGPIGIYGGFACDPSDGEAVNIAWVHSTAWHVTVAPPKGFALTIIHATAKVTISDIIFASADVGAGSSSIAASIASSSDVSLVRVGIISAPGGTALSAAPGDPGADRLDPSSAVPGLPPTCTNAPASQLGGHWDAPSKCGSSGGSGGSAIINSVGERGYAGRPQQNVLGENINNGGPAQTSLVQPASDGAPGSAGIDGLAGVAAGPGTFTASTSYMRGDGNPGTDGHTGQGGGGGGAALSTGGCVGGSGQAGGMGGCGGQHGLGGQGGGASVALIVWDSSVVLQDVSLRASKGGDAGYGGDGGAGGQGKSGTVMQNGSPAAPPVQPGGDGGRGGNGGNGGSGSGGTGGPSYALVYHGTKPMELGQMSLVFATGGVAGKGGAVGTDRLNPAPDGMPGPSGSRVQVTP